MTDAEIGRVLQVVCDKLTAEARRAGAFPTSKEFEDRVRQVLKDELVKRGKKIAKFADQDFPDIVVDDWGVEVKHTKEDKWRTVANSVFEGHRKEDVDRVFLVFAKMGGVPEVRWARYDDSVVHVRTSHRPRYEVEIGGTKSLFKQLGISYADFRDLNEVEKMRHIRAYARSRLGEGEQLWWLGDDPENPHSLPIAARLYIKLSKTEKEQLRAEMAFLCPEVVKSGRGKDKYNRGALYLLTYHGVLASQARDLFSAGSVADPGNKQRGGNYVLRALRHLEPILRDVAAALDPALIEEYWKEPDPGSPKKRLKRWLVLADVHAKGWKPSHDLFRDGV